MAGAILDYALDLRIIGEEWNLIKGLTSLEFTRTLDEGSGEMGGLTFELLPTDGYARQLFDAVRRFRGVVFRFRPHGEYRHGLYGRITKADWDPGVRSSKIRFVAQTEEAILAGIKIRGDIDIVQGTPGDVLAPFLAEMAARGLNAIVAGGRTGEFAETITAAPALRFSPEQDSNQKPWPRRYSLKFPAGTSALEAISKLCQLQAIEYEPIDGKLLVYRFGGLGLDYSAADENPHNVQITLRPGIQINSAPVSCTYADLATNIRVTGAENVGSVVIQNDGLLASLGYPLDYDETQQNIADRATLITYADALVERLSGQDQSIELGINLSLDDGTVIVIPGVTFWIGDWVNVQLPWGIKRMRVISWTLSWSGRQCTARITVGSRRRLQVFDLERAIQNAQSTAENVLPNEGTGVATQDADGNRSWVDDPAPTESGVLVRPDDGGHLVASRDLNVATVTATGRVQAAQVGTEEIFSSDGTMVVNLLRIDQIATQTTDASSSVPVLGSTSLGGPGIDAPGGGAVGFDAIYVYDSTDWNRYIPLSFTTLQDLGLQVLRRDGVLDTGGGGTGGGGTGGDGGPNSGGDNPHAPTAALSSREAVQNTDYTPTVSWDLPDGTSVTPGWDDAYDFTFIGGIISGGSCTITIPASYVGSAGAEHELTLTASTGAVSLFTVTTISDDL